MAIPKEPPCGVMEGSYTTLKESEYNELLATVKAADYNRGYLDGYTAAVQLLVGAWQERGKK